MSRSKAEKETIVRFSEDPEDKMTVYTFKERLAKRLLKAGGVLKQNSCTPGESWTVECPREWFREPRPRAKRILTEEQRAEAGARLQRARKGGIVLGALLFMWGFAQVGVSWAEEGRGRRILKSTAYYGVLSGSDWLLTRQAMSRGYGEANPAINRIGFGPAKALGLAAMVGGDYALRNHKKSKWVLRGVIGVGYGYAMVRAGRAK